MIGQHYHRMCSRVRKAMSWRCPGRFPGLYSTLDAPMEVPVQVAAYGLATKRYLLDGDRVCDVGFGLGYGLRIMAEKAGELVGIDIDRRAVARARSLMDKVPRITEVRRYDGHTIPYDAGSFDVVTCIDVIEHVPDYMMLIREMVRVSRRIVFLSTPNRVPENTGPDGKPRNHWHLREWSYEELDHILRGVPGIRLEWNFLDGPWEGPFKCAPAASGKTLALTPALILTPPRNGISGS